MVMNPKVSIRGYTIDQWLVAMVTFTRNQVWDVHPLAHDRAIALTTDPASVASLALSQGSPLSIVVGR